MFPSHPAKKSLGTGFCLLLKGKEIIRGHTHTQKKEQTSATEVFWPTATSSSLFLLPLSSHQLFLAVIQQFELIFNKLHPLWAALQFYQFYNYTSRSFQLFPTL